MVVKWSTSPMNEECFFVYLELPSFVKIQGRNKVIKTLNQRPGRGWVKFKDSNQTLEKWKGTYLSIALL